MTTSDQFTLMVDFLASKSNGAQEMSQEFQPGQSVNAKTMGAKPVTIPGTVKEVVGSARGSWVVVTPNDPSLKEVKTRPGLVTLAT